MIGIICTIAIMIGVAKLFCTLQQPVADALSSQFMMPKFFLNHQRGRFWSLRDFDQKDVYAEIWQSFDRYFRDALRLPSSSHASWMDAVLELNGVTRMIDGGHYVPLFQPKSNCSSNWWFSWPPPWPRPRPSTTLFIIKTIRSSSTWVTTPSSCPNT